MKRLLIFLFLAAFNIFAAENTPAFVSPLKVAAPLFDVNKDFMGPSIFLIIQGNSQQSTVYWTVDDARALLAHIELMDDAKKRSVSLASVAKFMVADPQKYKTNTALGNKIATLFNVFGIASRSFAHSLDWFIFDKNLSTVVSQDDASAVITNFVDPYVFSSQGNIVQNGALLPDDFAAALAHKKKLNQPFPFLYKPKPLLPFSSTAFKRFAKGVGAVAGISVVASFLSNVRKWSQETDKIVFTKQQEEILNHAKHLNGPCVALYRLYREGEVWYAPCSTSLRFDSTRIGENFKIGSSDIREYYFSEGDFWLPDQIKLLVDLVENDLTLLAPYGKRLFCDQAWFYDPARAENDFARFKALVRVLLPSIDGQDSAENSAGEVLEYVIDTATNIPKYVMSGPAGIAIKGVVGVPDNLDKGLSRIKNWANFVMRPTRLSEHGVKKAACQLTAAEKTDLGISYVDLYQIVCEMLFALSQTPGHPAINIPRLEHLQNYLFSKLSPHKFSQVGASVFYDTRFACASTVLGIDYDHGASLQGTHLSDIPKALIYGEGCGSYGPAVSPKKFNFDTHGVLGEGFVEAQGLTDFQKNAIMVARAQCLSAGPYFATLEATEAQDPFDVFSGEDAQSGAGFGSTATGVGAAKLPAMGRRVPGAPREEERAFPDWAYTNYVGKRYKDILPPVLAVVMPYNLDTEYLGLRRYYWQLPLVQDITKDPLVWYLTHPPVIDGKTFARLRFVHHEEQQGEQSVWVYSYNSAGGADLILKRFYIHNRYLETRNNHNQPILHSFGEFKIATPDASGEVQRNRDYGFDMREESFDYRIYARTMGLPNAFTHTFPLRSDEDTIDLYQFVLRSKKTIEYCDFRSFNIVDELDGFARDMIKNSLFPLARSWRRLPPPSVTKIEADGMLRVVSPDKSLARRTAWMRKNGINLYPYLRFVD